MKKTKKMKEKRTYLECRSPEAVPKETKKKRMLETFLNKENKKKNKRSRTYC